MTRLLLFSLVMVSIYQNGILGKPVYEDLASTQLVDFSDAEYPISDTQAKRNSYQVSHDADGPNAAEHSSLCYFIQESEIESQISCRLRFTRSKFNFNPFGLRFGKRQQGKLTSKRDPVTLSSIRMLPTLLKFKLYQMTTRCGDSEEQDC
uniref:Kisspeptin 2 n=1 Tax=Pelusios castaneus TaxID=367368 RepID=A0A8C8ST58_9SAUR